jgi:hypothetical protein
MGVLSLVETRKVQMFHNTNMRFSMASHSWLNNFPRFLLAHQYKVQQILNLYKEEDFQMILFLHKIEVPHKMWTIGYHIWYVLYIMKFNFCKSFKFMANPKWIFFIVVKHLPNMTNKIFNFQFLWTFHSIIVFFPQIFNVAMLVIFQKETYPNLVIKQLSKYKCIKILLYHG